MPAMSHDGQFFGWVTFIAVMTAAALGLGFAAGCSATMRAGVDVAEGRVHCRLSIYCLRDLLWAILLIAVVCGSLHQQVQLAVHRHSLKVTETHAVGAYVEASQARRLTKEEASDTAALFQQLHSVVGDLNDRVEQLELADEHVISF